MICCADVTAAVAREYGITVEDLTAKDGRFGARLKKYAQPRQIAMKLSREMVVVKNTDKRLHSRLSLGQIGRRFGNRDHTTVLHAVRTVDHLYATDPQVRSKIDSLSVGLLLAGCA